MNQSHTPHHAPADKISPASHGKGITTNLKKWLHKKTRTYKRNPTRGRSYSNTDEFHADAENIRRILKKDDYDPHIVERHINELTRQVYDAYGW